MSDFILRLILRCNHNLIVSSCCNNGVPIQEEVYDPKSRVPETDSEDEIYFDARSTTCSTKDSHQSNDSSDT